MFKAILVLCLATASCSAQAVRWVEIGPNLDGSGTAYYDADSISRKGDEVTFRTVMDFKTPRPELSSTMTWRAQCKRKLLAHTSSASYAGRMATGKVFNEYSSLSPIFPDEVPWAPVFPGGVSERDWNIACAGRDGRGTQGVSRPTASAGAGSSPSEAFMKQHVEDQLRQRAKGLVRLSAFKKTDGLASEAFGVKMYEMDWVAMLELTNGCWFNADTFAAESVPPGHLDEILLASNGFKKYPTPRLELTGKTKFQRSEAGWRVTR